MKQTQIEMLSTGTSVEVSPHPPMKCSFNPLNSFLTNQLIFPCCDDLHLVENHLITLLDAEI